MESAFQFLVQLFKNFRAAHQLAARGAAKIVGRYKYEQKKDSKVLICLKINKEKSEKLTYIFQNIFFLLPNEETFLKVFSSS